MRAILIDPYAKTVTEIDEPKIDLPAMRRLTECGTINIDVKFPGHYVVIDDEGLICDPPKPLFEIGTYPQPLAGKGLFVGEEDQDGNITDATVPLDTLRAAVRFRDDIEIEDIVTVEDFVDHPMLGPDTFRVSNIPVFRKKDPAKE